MPEPNLLADRDLEDSAVVANCQMNRERSLHGSNGYDRDLRFDPVEFLANAVATRGSARWLDLCCGSGKALVEAAREFQADSLNVSIVGVDLVGMFIANRCDGLELIEASLSHWRPTQSFDLITCVHGLHYVGDKLSLLRRTVSWLTPEGKFAANLDKSNILLDGGNSDRIFKSLRDQGFQYQSRQRLLVFSGRQTIELPFRYLGANDQAGPNYTGQPAVNSHYELRAGAP